MGLYALRAPRIPKRSPEPSLSKITPCESPRSPVHSRTRKARPPRERGTGEPTAWLGGHRHAYCRPATPPPHPERGRVVAVPSPRRLPGARGRAEGRPGFGCAAGPGSRTARDLRLDAKETPSAVAKGVSSRVLAKSPAKAGSPSVADSILT